METYIKLYFTYCRNKPIVSIMKDEDYLEMTKRGQTLVEHYPTMKMIETKDISDDEYQAIKAIMGEPFNTVVFGKIEITTESFWI